MKNKTTRIVLISICSLLIMAIVGLMALAFYINKNEEKIVTEIRARANEKINGTLSIEKMSTSLLSNFPKVTVVMENVTLRDSIWHIHKHDFIQAEKLLVSIDLMELLKNTIKINQVRMKKGAINIFTDSTGYCNLSAIRSNSDTAKAKKETEFDRITLTDVVFTFINVPKFKNFQIDIQELSGKLKYKAEVIDIIADIDVKMNSFTFNINKGSYMAGRVLTAQLKAQYNKNKQALLIPEQQIKLDKQPLQFGGNFNFLKKPAQFEINVKADEIPYKTAISYLSPNINKQLKPYNFEDDLWLSAKVSGQMKFRAIPHVQVVFKAKDNTLYTSSGNIEKLEFFGKYDNVAVPGLKQSDSNTLISFFELKGEFEKIPLYVDTLMVLNILEPKVKTRLRSNFPADRLNKFLEGSNFQLDKGGLVNIDIRYEGGASPKDTIAPSMKGFAQLKNAGLKYWRRNLYFKNMNADIRFQGADILFKSISAKTYSSSISLTGYARNFLNLYFTDPAAVHINFEVKSDQINLSEFLSALEVNEGNSKKSTSPKTTPMGYANRVNNAINQGTVSLQTNIKELRYKKFVAHQIKGAATFAGKDIHLKQFGFNAANGSMSVNGKLTDMGNHNPFQIAVNMNKVDAPKVLFAFDNFGMQSLQAKNITGQLSTNSQLTGRLRPDGSVIGKSLNGTIQLQLNNGALINFEPIQKIGNLIYRNRNVDNIQIKPIDHTFTVRNGTIYIKPLIIETSALYLSVQGEYNAKQGTDLAVAIPLRNPKKDDFNPNSEKQIENFRKGLVINLRLTDDEQGKLEIDWDPTRKGGGIYSVNPPEQEENQANPTTQQDTIPKEKQKGFFRKIFK